MNPQLLPATARDDVPAWQQTVVAFLAEKERRSGSHRTVEGYARMLWPFLGRVGSPDRVTPAHVLAWAHGIGASGREPSSATVGARIACLSSYYRFLIRMNVAASNPCDALERPRTVQSVARGLSADEVRRLLAVVPDTVAGRRDRALLLVFVLTGRRRTEVIGLTAGDVSVEGDTAFYSYRGKGGKRGRRELPRPAYEALRATLRDAGLVLAEMAPAASLWQAGASTRGITSSTFYARFRRYLRTAGLPPTGLHILRHTAAKLRRDAGASIEAVSSFLDHSSLAVTSVYLRRLEGEADRTWPEVAIAIGV
ncbi:MAG: tyrosine-type recombinase/integrase [Candidatus Limnocylindrales bacterium]